MIKMRCKICGKEIERISNRQLYCSVCAYQKFLERKRKNEQRWRKENPERYKKRKREAYLRLKKRNPDYWKNYNANHREKRRETSRKSNKKWRLKVRMIVLKHYSNKEIPECAICGENHIEFLGIDHMKGGGNKHRKSFKGKYRSINEFLYSNNFPKGFRVLCHNCNMSIGFYGYSPYEKNNSKKTTNSL